MILAAKFYERGILTIRQAAKFAGLSYREFIEVLGSDGVSFMNYPADEIARDLKNEEGCNRGHKLFHCA